MLKLRLFTDGDMPVIKAWLNKERIKKWYEVPGLCSVGDWLGEIENRGEEFSFITHFIAVWEEKPVGFCQYYKCADAREEWYGKTPLNGTYSIDYLIGEDDFIGKGFGKAMIALLIGKIFLLPDGERIIVQPDGGNGASCNALLSNGFIFDGENNVYLKSKQENF